MIFYGSVALGLLLAMAGLAYFFPEYGMRLLNAASKKFWALLKPELFKRMPPDKEKAWNVFNRSNPTPREQRAWLKKWDLDHPNE